MHQTFCNWKKKLALFPVVHGGQGSAILYFFIATAKDNDLQVKWVEFSAYKISINF
ncbi:hypothetical protein [Fluviispira sanaruensis]|uniref:Uncharacterized protein n=1 Tax=Fluviispira sanaruensis TaxID=2493639 RepID=A0A4P2VXR2_FLUSA|nr:hypothetical protein [Fluviispira sanaruensis]BBH54435.1 hypothetical protein JCM31447_29000 [Fluviispira sanaruensis]